jgi:GNAT superfamily N-acetyltransferase
VQPVQVRRAAPGDAEQLSELQVASQRDLGRRLLPAGALDALSVAAVLPSWRQLLDGGEELVLVALDEQGHARGAAVLGPAGDEDLHEGGWHELALLVVDPARRGHGHGSRLLAAVADHARAAGGRGLVSWVLAADGEGVGFLRGAGWQPDGSRRELDAGEPVIEIRLRTEL